MSLSVRWTHFAGALFSMLLLACGGENSRPSQAPDVYVAGFVDNGTVYVAMCWKNGIPQALTDGTRSAKALSVYVAGGDVYVAGGQSSANGPDVATYWKNGVAVALTDGTTDAMAESIVVSGGDIYVAGYQTQASGGDVITYWKNGVAVPLTGPSNGEARSIAVSGNDVYVVGWTTDTIEYAPNMFLTAPVAKLWKNGVLTPLNDLATTNAVAESVVVSGSDVYVAGYAAPTLYTAGSEPWTAQFWKNGTALPLSDGINGAKAFAIAVVGDSVFTAGFTSAGAGAIATIWRNGSPVRWTNGSLDAVVLALAVPSTKFMTDHFPAGEYAAGFEGSTAKVWVNGVAKNLTDGSREAEAWGIFVVTH